MTTKTYKVDGLDCAHCAGKFEAEANKLEGVECKLNFALGTMKITTERDIAETEKAVVRILKRIEPDARMSAK